MELGGDTGGSENGETKGTHVIESKGRAGSKGDASTSEHCLQTKSHVSDLKQDRRKHKLKGVPTPATKKAKV